MTSFLDLPRELRDIIYNHALISPTGYVLPRLYKIQTPLPANASRKAKALPPKIQLQLQLEPCTANLYNEHVPVLPLAISIVLANRQIYQETMDMLWKRNILCLPSPTDAIAVLKHMGQTPSRKIENLVLHLNPWNFDREKAGIAKALSMLASRARRGKMVSIRLVIYRFGDMTPQPSDGLVIGDGVSGERVRVGIRNYYGPMWFDSLGEILQTSAEAGWGSRNILRVLKYDNLHRWVPRDENRRYIFGANERDEIEDEGRLLAAAWGLKRVRISGRWAEC